MGDAAAMEPSPAVMQWTGTAKWKGAPGAGNSVTSFFSSPRCGCSSSCGCLSSEAEWNAAGDDFSCQPTRALNEPLHILIDLIAILDSLTVCEQFKLKASKSQLLMKAD